MMDANMRESKILYVSPSGRDSNPGTREQPLASLDGARDLVRRLDKAACSGITVYLRGGRYFLRGTVAFNASDSGLEGCPIRYEAYPSEEVFLDGGVVIECKDVQPLADPVVISRIIEHDAVPHIRVVNLDGRGIEPFGAYGNRGFRRPYIPAPNELFINGKPQRIAQYPKADEEQLPLRRENLLDGGSKPRDGEFDLRPAVLQYDNERLRRWSSAKDAYVSGYFAASYADDSIRVAGIDPVRRTITTTLPHLYGFAESGQASWCMVNLIEELGRPGEYFIDAEARKLYFYPETEEAGLFIQISVLDKVMLAFEGASFITVKGLTFENSRSSGVYIENGESIRITRCVFRNLGMLAVQIGRGATPMPDGLHNCHGVRAPGVPLPAEMSREPGCWHEYLYEFAAWDNHGGRNHAVDNCEIRHTAAGGILLGGGNRKTLTPGNNIVHNCHIHECNRLDKTYKSAINISGVGNKITHCHIHDLPGIAIYLHGNDHLVEYNRIHHVLKEVSDAGAIYMGRDMSEVGNIFRHNFIYSIHNPHKSSLGVSAIYFDDRAIYNQIYGNCFYDIVSDGQMFFSTIYHTCGGLTSIGNNIFIDCVPGLDPNVHGNAHLKMHEDPLAAARVHTTDVNDLRGVDVTSPVYREKFPYLYETYLHDFHPGTPFWNNLVYYKNYDCFVDAETLNFNFKPGAVFGNQNQPDYRVTDVVYGVRNETIPLRTDIDFDQIGIVEERIHSKEY